MDHQEGFFEGIRRIYYQCWLPDGAPRAVLVVVHGYGEHSGRYMNVVNCLVPDGYAVYALDHVGHGRSEGTRVYVDRFTDYTVTLQTFVDMVRGWQPTLPLFLFGHSMGSLITTRFLLDRPSGIAGVVLSGTATEVTDSVSPVTILLGKVLAVLAPKTGVVAIEADAICRDPAVVEAYVQDPLVYTGKMTARLAAEYLKTQQRVTAEASTIAEPILLVHGADDKLTPLSGARSLYEALGSTDKTLKVYDGLYHEVCNEPECDEVLGDIEAWLEAHLA
jgi:alpha-beta hydrolase superfamily lysophospholipase